MNDNDDANVLADEDGDHGLFERGNLLTLLVLSLGAALVPWFGQADVGVSLAFSIVSLALPAAALRAASRGEVEDEDNPDDYSGCFKQRT